MHKRNQESVIQGKKKKLSRKVVRSGAGGTIRSSMNMKN
jgi:hypothetical protein